MPLLIRWSEDAKQRHGRNSPQETQCGPLTAADAQSARQTSAATPPRPLAVKVPSLPWVSCAALLLPSLTKTLRFSHPRHSLHCCNLPPFRFGNNKHRPSNIKQHYYRLSQILPFLCQRCEPCWRGGLVLFHVLLIFKHCKTFQVFNQYCNQRTTSEPQEWDCFFSHRISVPHAMGAIPNVLVGLVTGYFCDTSFRWKSSRRRRRKLSLKYIVTIFMYVIIRHVSNERRPYN